MPRRWAGVGVGGCLCLLLVHGRAAAQEPEVFPPQGGPDAFSAEQARDLARLDALIQSHALEARDQRLALGGVCIATGLVAIPVGIVAQTSWNQDYGVGLWVSGALLVGLGATSLVLESPLERLAAAFQATAGLPPAQRLVFGERSLAEVASAARTGRSISAVLSFAFAGLFVGIAIGDLVSAPNNVGSNKTDLQSSAAGGLILGGLFVGAGVVTLLFPTPAETADAVYQSGKPVGPTGFRISAGVAPLHGGAVLGLSGAF